MNLSFFFISQTSASGSAPPDKDVIPLCTCKISGASFQKMSSSVTFCQAIDSVDGKVRLGIVWEVNGWLVLSASLFKSTLNTFAFTSQIFFSVIKIFDIIWKRFFYLQNFYWQSMRKLFSYHRTIWLIISKFLPVMANFFHVTSLNIEQNLTKVTSHCDR